MEDDPRRQYLRGGFDLAAEDYQRTRPVCPPQLFDDLIDRAGPGGAIAIARCLWARPADAERFWTDVQEDYRAVGFAGSPPPPPEQIGLRHFPPEAGSLFEEVASLRYPFEVRYSAADYLANLATQSSTRALGEARSAEFLARVRHRLEALGWPQLTATFVGQLTVGKRT